MLLSCFLPPGLELASCGAGMCATAHVACDQGPTSLPTINVGATAPLAPPALLRLLLVLAPEH